MMPEDLEAQALLAEALAACGEYEHSLNAYKETFESSLPQDPIWHSRLSKGLGGVALHLGDVEMAVTALHEGLVADPKNQQLLQKKQQVVQKLSLPIKMAIKKH